MLLVSSGISVVLAIMTDLLTVRLDFSSNIYCFNFDF